MFLQGDLQAVFDALYSIGAIDPVLKADWAEISDEMMENPAVVNEALSSLNSCSGDRERLIQKLHSFDPKTLSFVALEVARELAEYTDRQSLH